MDRLWTFPVWGHSVGKVSRLCEDSVDRRPQLNGGNVTQNSDCRCCDFTDVLSEPATCVPRVVKVRVNFLKRAQEP